MVIGLGQMVYVGNFTFKDGDRGIGTLSPFDKDELFLGTARFYFDKWPVKYEGLGLYYH